MMSSEQIYDLLAALLDCDYSDPCVLEGVEYDMSDLVEDCNMSFGKVTLNELMMSAFAFGLRDFRKSIDERIEDLEHADELTGDEKEELDALKQLDPENDADSFHNYQDTSIWFRENKELYEKYCQKECDEFYENTGYDIGC